MNEALRYCLIAFLPPFLPRLAAGFLPDRGLAALLHAVIQYLRP